MRNDEAAMQALVTAHMDAEMRGDVDGAVAVYADDIEHDVVGFPGSPQYGRDGARAFYEYLGDNFRTENLEILHRYAAETALILEQRMTGVVIGSMLGLPGRNRRINFRIMHVFEFTGGRISRENIWLDTAAIVAQLS